MRSPDRYQNLDIFVTEYLGKTPMPGILNTLSKSLSENFCKVNFWTYLHN